MKKFSSGALAALALVALTNPAVADTNLLADDNYSFEDPVIATDPAAISGQYVLVTSLPDWTFSTAGGGSEVAGVQTISSAFDNAGTSDGLNYALLNIQQNGPGTITYDGTGADALPVIAANTDYTLTVAVGNRLQGSADGGTDTIDLLAGTTAFGTTVNETQITPDTFTDETVTLSAATIQEDNLVGKSLGIELVGSQYGGDGFDQAAFDNVRLTAATDVPTPIATLYYDTNGSTGGTATSSTQNFTDLVWTTDLTGSSTTTGYTPGSDVVFSATDGVNVGTGTQSVTVTDTELVHSFTFNNGAVTLLGSGSPNLHIAAGGITVNSNDGATTFDSTLGTVTLDADQSWNNDSTQAFNVNSGVTASGNTLTFGGTGVGKINLNGQLTGSLNLTATSPTSAVNVENGGNNFVGMIAIDGGVVNFANIGSLGNGGNAIDLSDGGTVSFDNTQNYADYDNTINLGVGGGQISAGVVGGVGIDIVYGGTITGGTGLTLVGGDMLLSAASGSDMGTLNVKDGRLLAISNGDFDNNTVVNVSSGAIMDYGIGQTQVPNGLGGYTIIPLTLTNQINLANGSALENRGAGLTDTDVVFPTGTATVTLGADDVGGGFMILNGPTINLASGTTLTIVANAAEHYTEYTSTDLPPPVTTSDPNFNAVYNSTGITQTAVYLEEQITGAGNLVITPEEAPVINYEADPSNPSGDIVGYRLGQGSPIYLDGANNYSGTTTVDGAIVYVGASGFGTSAVTLNGNPFQTPYFDNVTQLELSGGTFANTVTVGIGTNVMNLIGGSPDETISGPITITADNSVLVVENSSASTLNVGNIHFNAIPGGTGSHDVNFEDYGAGPIVLTGTYNSDAEAQSDSAITLNFGQSGEGGTYNLASTADFTGMQTNNPRGPGALDLWTGTLNIETSNFAGQTIVVQNYPGANQTVNVVGAQTIDANFYVNIATSVPYDTTGDYTQTPGGAWNLAQTTADLSTIEGSLSQQYATGLTVSAVDGGRLVLAGDVGGYFSNTVTTSAGTYNEPGPGTLVKTGAGTVVFSDTNGNDFQSPNGVVADVQQGTLLVNNSQGYGLGTSTGNINIEKGATFGGSNLLSGNQTIVSENAGSIIAPGDAGQASLGIAPTMGIMTIAGNLVTASNANPADDGLTLNFKLNGYSDGGVGDNNPGVNNDELVVNNMTLNGTITVNLTAVGTAPLQTGYGNYYILMEGSGTWSGDPNFVINAPAGYALDNTFGEYDANGNQLGYLYDNSSEDILIIQLVAVPEPSTYALMGLGLLALVAFRRVRKMHT